MVNNIVIGTYVLHMGQLMVNITAHRTFKLFFRLKYGCGLYAKMSNTYFCKQNSSGRSTRPGASRPLFPRVLFDILAHGKRS
jgi:hypothetical protein